MVIQILRLEVCRRWRAAIVEESDSTANRRAVILERKIENRETGRNVVVPGNTVAVKTQPGVYSQVFIDDPAILSESAELWHRALNGRWLSEVDALAEALVSTTDQNRSEV